ncbi:site-specific integrase [Nodosilinea sp. LEGE 06152]|uniref:site-specific integrase n=1 Tax=Nodosilinea sp. LEGE 06152 TaxID=2777966 RepID=UPI001882F147|nr:site-specific integrase [Nodosilinea sp. LEGE 06152]MBE9158625.1 site-specific integrase [Nodosilinea sp. LEGE 06152]
MAVSASLDRAIAALNTRFKAARLGLQVECRGDRLSLRGTLPPRPDSTKTRPHQQRIPLKLPATAAGLKQIEREAKVIAAQLIERRFSWADYLSQAEALQPEGVPLVERVAQFEADVLAQAGPGAAALASRKTTWEKAYAPYLKKLLVQVEQQPRQALDAAIVATLEALPPHSRSRQVACTALKAFADFQGVALPEDIDKLGGQYGSSKAQRRLLPSDEVIVEWCDRIPNPAWRYVYGVMATYGLRNHEVFFCDYQALHRGDLEGRITVLETTKTGLHDVWPFYPEWVDRFGLRQGQLPPINTDLTTTTLQRVGQQVAIQFKRYGVPFSPYDLRHAWAVRTIHFGLPDTVAARMMGHSVAIHNRTYHRWITHRDQRQAVQTALQNHPWQAPT